MYFFLGLVDIVCSVSSFVLETALVRPEQRAYLSHLLFCDKHTFSWSFFGSLGALLLPCPSKLPTSQGTSITSACVVSPLLWQDEGLLTPVNIDSEIAVYHLPCY